MVFDANNIVRIPTQANLYYCNTYLKRYGAISFSFEHNGMHYKQAAEYDTGNFGILAFLKLIRQYFSRRTVEENTVFFKNVPVSSLEDKQNISIMFNFYTIDDTLEFGYEVRNTDTNVILVSDSRDNIQKEMYYQQPVDLNECNLCSNEDYIFDDDDFDNDAEYAYFAQY